MNAIIIDGWHRGVFVSMRELPPVIKLKRAPTTTWCSCNSEREPNDFQNESSTDEYRVAFRSIDGNFFLYSTDGNSKQIVHLFRRLNFSKDGRPHTFMADDLYHVDCRDYHAFGGEK